LELIVVTVCVDEPATDALVELPELPLPSDPLLPESAPRNS
jgi:hypothetical protein